MQGSVVVNVVVKSSNLLGPVSLIYIRFLIWIQLISYTLKSELYS